MELKKRKPNIFFGMCLAAVVVFGLAGFTVYEQRREFLENVFSSFFGALIAILAVAVVIGLTLAYLKGLSREIESRIEK